MSLQDQVLGTFRNFNGELNKSSFLNRIEQQTQLPKIYGVGGFGVAYLAIIFLNIGGIGELFSNIATLIIPGYYSLIALETTTTKDDTQFLTYWVVYAAFSVLEFWSSIILYWVPFYWLFKTILFLYLGLPQFGGARLVYQHVLRPISINVLHIGGSSANIKEQISATTTGAHL